LLSKELGGSKIRKPIKLIIIIASAIYTGKHSGLVNCSPRLMAKYSDADSIYIQ
jgi:hypothetical protein